MKQHGNDMRRTYYFRYDKSLNWSFNMTKMHGVCGSMACVFWTALWRGLSRHASQPGSQVCRTCIVTDRDYGFQLCKVGQQLGVYQLRDCSSFQPSLIRLRIHVSQPTAWEHSLVCLNCFLWLNYTIEQQRQSKCIFVLWYARQIAKCVWFCATILPLSIQI